MTGKGGGGGGEGGTEGHEVEVMKEDVKERVQDIM